MSIRRSRRRPRVTSVSFQSFAWLLKREALVMASRYAAPTIPERDLRRAALRLEGWEVEQRFRVVIGQCPMARWPS